MSISSFAENQYDKEYYIYHLDLLNAFIGLIKQQPPFIYEDISTDDAEFLAALDELARNSQAADWLENGQMLMCRIVGSYPHLMPLLYRDLLWFFGGDCLHYMPDDEISVFQQLDELRETAKSEGQPFNYKETRAKLMGMH
jgi:hypothetical protein